MSAGAIGHQRSDPIARVQPQTEQTDSQAIAEVIERAPRPARIRTDQREPVRIGIQTGAKQTAQAHRPLQRPSGIPGHAVTPVSEINIETLQKRRRSRLPGVARFVARAGAVRAVTGAADPRHTPAVSTPAKQTMGARPQAQARPHDTSETTSNPRGTARCGRHGSTGASPSTSVLDRALSRSILAMGGQAPPPSAASAQRAHRDTRVPCGRRDPAHDQTAVPPLRSARRSDSRSVCRSPDRPWPPAHELDGDQIPNASQNRPKPEIAGPRPAPDSATDR
jgi:hypothetical protein